ncbi:sulfotransferase family protein [Chitiniphilus eburneus]|nr:sulfotransferase family protein [Chitiniphilus eburneus]
MDYRDWLPIRAWGAEGGWSIDWAWFGAAPLTEPFFQDSIEAALRRPFNQALRRQTAMAELSRWREASPGVPLQALVYHASRCGSTLITRMLCALDSHAVYAEPPPLDAVLRAPWRDATAEAHQGAWLRDLVSALGQRRQGAEQCVVIKLDAWNIFEADRMRAAFPDVPGIYLYRHPLEIAVSHLRQPGRHMVPGLIGASPLAFAPDEAAAMPRVQFIARTLGRLLAAGLAQCEARHLLPVNYLELPHAVCGRLGDLLGVPPACNEAVLAQAAHHAKQPQATFAEDGASKRAEAPAALIEAIEQWAMPSYRALEALRSGSA